MRPKPLTFVVHDYLKIRDYLIAEGVISRDDADTFWGWWCDIGELANRAIRNVPLGYWGWTDEKPQRQSPPSDPSEESRTVHRVLTALEQFCDKEHDLRVWLAW